MLLASLFVSATLMAALQIIAALEEDDRRGQTIFQRFETQPGTSPPRLAVSLAQEGKRPVQEPLPDARGRQERREHERFQFHRLGGGLRDHKGSHVWSADSALPGLVAPLDTGNRRGSDTN